MIVKAGNAPIHSVRFALTFDRRAPEASAEDRLLSITDRVRQPRLQEGLGPSGNPDCIGPASKELQTR
jgi:hypothetical protein